MDKRHGPFKKEHKWSFDHLHYIKHTKTREVWMKSIFCVITSLEAQGIQKMHHNTVSLDFFK